MQHALATRRMTLLAQALFASAVAAYAYYSVWVLLTPFVDKDVPWFHSFFPDRWWAIAVPTATLVLGLTLVGTFLGLVFAGGREPREPRRTMPPLSTPTGS